MQRELNYVAQQYLSSDNPRAQLSTFCRNRHFFRQNCGDFASFHPKKIKKIHQHKDVNFITDISMSCNTDAVDGVNA